MTDGGENTWYKYDRKARRGRTARLPDWHNTGESFGVGSGLVVSLATIKINTSKSSLSLNIRLVVEYSIIIIILSVGVFLCVIGFLYAVVVWFVVY